ncbi:hypothetical protein CAC42_1309 [Sphaceloma murrayae]|uniref:Uncharacterized protein n=1 Tax=Sphaceloma murrayae TaxID=2082308 RepID=A0A2K1QFH4_9PEZI|nr:hypothetical protein CAC42_1309 [Sphaceloma murrayae]
MTAGQEGPLSAATEEADLAKAFQAIAQGEQTATQLENNLSKLEAKIDELMKQANENQEVVQAAKAEKASTDTTGEAASHDPKGNGSSK